MNEKMTPNTTGSKRLITKPIAALSALIVVYICLALAHAFSTPLGFTGYQDAPDEGAHISYIQSLNAGLMPSKLYPHAAANSSLPDYEWHQPPLYYKACTLVSGGSPATDGFAARFLSIAAGAGCVIAAFFIAAEIRPRDPVVALTAAGIAALIPGHISILSTVNNDCFLELFMSLCLLTLLRTQNREKGPGKYDGLIAGAFAAAAILSKATGLIAVAAALGSVLLMLLRGTHRKSVAVFGVQFAVVMAACTGWWFLRNLSLYHEMVPLKTFRESFSGTAMAQDVISGKIHLGVTDWQGYWMLVGSWAFKSFWAVYGTAASAGIGVPLFLPDTIYLLSLVLCLGAAAGMVKLHFKRLDLFTSGQRAGLYILFLVFALAFLAYAKFASEFFQTQGRYLYPAMAPIALILAMGWTAIFPDRYRKAGAAGALLVLGLIAVIFTLQTSNRGGVHPPVPLTGISREIKQKGDLHIG
jgi:Dolichyl-phosphate-mannose-protein mannosyltransferase